MEQLSQVEKNRRGTKSKVILKLNRNGEMAFFSQTSSAVSRTRATSGAEVALGPREKFRSKEPLRLTSRVPTGWGWGGKRGG